MPKYVAAAEEHQGCQSEDCQGDADADSRFGASTEGGGGVGCWVGTWMRGWGGGGGGGGCWWGNTGCGFWRRGCRCGGFGGRWGSDGGGAGVGEGDGVPI